MIFSKFIISQNKVMLYQAMKEYMTLQQEKYIKQKMDLWNMIGMEGIKK